MPHKYKCKENNCNIQPAYNYDNNLKGLYCNKHKKDNMINVIGPHCLYQNCKTRPIYNFSDNNKGIYCKKHKQEGMLNIINKKRCIEEECNKFPSYNYINNKALYCFTHKKENMINVVSKRCIYDNCNKIPIYNYENEHTGIYCKEHCLDNMINIKDNKCIEKECMIRSNYNLDGQKRGLYCFKHKKEEMIDVINKKCIYNNCKTRPSFNYIYNISPIYCAKHRLDDMINISDNKCINLNCNIIATYNYEEKTYAIYCSSHKKEGMIDIRSRCCITPLCYTRVHNNKYNGYCLRCFVYLFPDKPNSHNYKTKEISVVEYIKKEFEDITIITDKKIQEGCSRRRPDILIDLGYQVIIVEVDENQHIDYDCSCENKRIMELSQDIGHRPIIFIRFNPDDYLDKDNNIITSCWGIDKRGICCIKKIKTNEWNERLIILKENIQYWKDNNTNKTVEIIQLFYNQNNIL